MLGAATRIGLHHLRSLSEVLRSCAPGLWPDLLKSYCWITVVKSCLRTNATDFGRLVSLLERAERRGCAAGSRPDALRDYEAAYWSVQGAGLAFGGLTCRRTRRHASCSFAAREVR